MGIGSIAGGYANFIFGTGQEVVSNAVSNAIKNRGAANQCYLSSLYSGAKTGIGDSYNAMKAKGGYLTAIKGDLSAMWQGLKKGKISALGKGFPLLMSALWVAGEAGNIIGATKDEGVVGGVKETGRTAASMTLGTLFSSIAQGMCKAKGKGGIWGIAASIGGYMLGATISGKLFGKSYTERKAEIAEGQQQTQQIPEQQYQPMTVPPPVVTNIPNISPSFNGEMSMPQPNVPQFPPIEAGAGGGYYGIASGLTPNIMGMGTMGMPMMGMGMMGASGMGSTNGNLLMN